jgi:hypothetical protein
MADPILMALPGSLTDAVFSNLLAESGFSERVRSWLKTSHI